MFNDTKILDLEKRLASIENKVGDGFDVGGIVHQQLTSRSTIVNQSLTRFGLFTALCVDTVDIWKQNKVRFFSPILHHPKSTVAELPWANAISSMGGFDDSGLTWVPPAGSTLCIVFENGNVESPYYIGTTWNRSRGTGENKNWGIPVPEYEKIWAGKRDGYLVGPNDESQVFPPWNTENYNGFDITSFIDFAQNPEAQKLITSPNIYGFSTPEKHRFKMVDGDPNCNRKWKRFEIMSSCGNLIMLKDDHLHYAGQWAHPDCGVQDGETSCVEGANNSSQVDTLATALKPSLLSSGGPSHPSPDNQDFSQATGITLGTGKKKEEDGCDGKESNKKIIGGHPSTGHPATKYPENQVGANPFFKNQQECRPYRGPGTPQNPVCDLPQTGIQIMSISGHTFVMDDSVEEPGGDPVWKRATEPFDFGCNNKYVGRAYWQSATGHKIELSDVEGPQGDEGSNLRGEDNYIRLLSATGNKIELNDHTVSKKDCPGCPPNIAGEQRGIHLQSTSNHTIDMCDDTNEQCSGCRMNGGVPIPKAKKAFVRIRTGYGLMMSFNDDNSQENTVQQNIEIRCPQNDNKKRGPHIHRYLEAPDGPGQVNLIVGGNYTINTFDNQISTIGNPDNPDGGSKVEIINKDKYVYTKEGYKNVTDKSHLFMAKEKIYLLAGEDCVPDAKPCENCGGEVPCFGPVLVYDLCKQCVRLSDRVFASTSGAATPLTIAMLLREPETCDNSTPPSSDPNHSQGIFTGTLV